jgi:hypothetical protein
MSTWKNAVSGNFNTAKNWNPNHVPTTADDASITATGAAFTVTAATDEYVASLETSADATLFLKGDATTAHTFTIQNGTGTGASAGLIKVGDNFTLQMLASGGKDETTFVNSGEISLNAKSQNSFLEVQTNNNGGGGFLDLTGGGSIVMSDNAGNGIVDTLTSVYENFLLENFDNTISGAGVIGNGGLANGIELEIENGVAGVINATGVHNPLIISAPSKYGFTNLVNGGLVEATGAAGLDIAATFVNNEGGTILAGTGSIVRLESSSVHGGALQTMGTGVILASGGSTLDGTGSYGILTNAGVVQDFGETMYAMGQITNTGAINLSDQVSGAILQVNTPGLTLSGHGTVTLTDNFQNGIQGDGSGSVLVNVDNTISGAGTVGGNQLGLNNSKSGVIDATGTYNALRLYGPGLTFANTGLIEATGKGGLDVAAVTLDQTGGGRLFVGAGSTMRLESASLVGGILSNAVGGEIDASGGSSFAGVTFTNSGLLAVADSDTLSAAGSIGNAGTISLAGMASAAQLMLTGNLSLSGGGQVLLGEGGVISSAASGDTFTNVDNKITGDGELGGGATKLINQAAGVINETGTTGLLIASASLVNAGLIEASGVGDVSVLASVVNSGTLEANTGSMLSLTGAVKNNGVLEANGGTVIAYKAVSGTGSAEIAGGLLDFTKTFNQAVTFVGGAGELELRNSQSYTAAVTGFSTKGGTSFDLRDINFANAGEATFSGTMSGGTLTVTDGTHTAHIDLVGDYTGATFVTSKDGHGGVIVKTTAAVMAPPPAGFAAAMASLAPQAAAPAPANQTHDYAAHILAVPHRAALA